jgi:cyclase
VEEWIARADSLGAGEFLVTSIDQDGTLRGPDHDLLLACRKVSNRPMVASGGFKSNLEIQEVLSDFDYQGVALGSALHYNKLSLPELRFQLKSAGVEVR